MNEVERPGRAIDVERDAPAAAAALGSIDGGVRGRNILNAAARKSLESL